VRLGARSPEAHMYIGVGTLVLILLVVVIMMFMRGRA
jgi:hypothetical protein